MSSAMECSTVGTGEAVRGKPEALHFEKVGREVALHLVETVETDCDIKFKLTRLPDIHSLPNFNRKMETASKIAKNISNYIGEEFAADMASQASAVLWECKTKFPSKFQSKLQEFLLHEVIRKYEVHGWRMMDTIFYVVYSLALEIKYDATVDDRKLALYEAVVEACYDALRRHPMEETLGSWVRLHKNIASEV